MLRGAELMRAFATLALVGAALCTPAAAQVSVSRTPPPIAPLSAHLAAPQIKARLEASAHPDVHGFYAARAYQPLWLNAEGALDSAAPVLLGLVETAHLDGIDTAALNPGSLAAAVRTAETERSPAALAEAEVLLSVALAKYAGAMLSAGDAQMIYEHELLQPYLLTGPSILEQALGAGSLHDYVTEMRWMHPLYPQLRRAIASGSHGPAELQPLIGNLERVRGIPRGRGGRHVIVDSASSMLWMYEGDQVVDSMKVIVGTAETPTPIMAGYIRTAVFNPYWNVPTDMLRKTIARRARNMGVAYLRRGGYQVVSAWGPDAELLDPSGIDWRAVERGDVDVAVRQLPSATSAMGKMKFELPNPQGIYLHDTPDKPLMLKAVRQLSNGCIRLEDAARFGRWLMGGTLPSVSSAPEQRFDLAEPVPIYMTYLTTHVVEGQLTVGLDPYGLYPAQAQGAALASRPE